YKDIAYYFGALSPYLNAFLFRAFGTHLMVISVFNILLVIALTFLIYRIFIKTTDKITATAVATTFLAIFAFSQYFKDVGNYNFVSPYTYGVTYGLFLAFLSISIFITYLESRKNRFLFIIGILTGLIFFTKPEVFFAISVATALGIALVIFIDQPGNKKVLKIFSISALGFFVPVIAFLIYFSNHMPFSDALRAITMPYAVVFSNSPISNIFYRKMIGLDDTIINLLKMLFVSGWYLVVILFLSLIDFKIGLRKTLFNLVLFFSLCLIVCNSWDQLFRGLPVVLLLFGGGICFALFSFRNDPLKISRLLPLFVMTIFAFILLFKIILNVCIFHYGFALTLPAVLLLVAIFTYHLPEFLKIKYKKASYARFLGLVLLGVVLFTYMNVSRCIYSAKTCRIGNGLDTILDLDKNLSTHGTYVNLALDKIEEIVKKDEKFLVFPEGIILNYLTRRDSPSKYVGFSFVELDVFGENNILNSLIKNKPDYIIIVDRDVSEFGYVYSNKTYAPKITSWINKNYLPVYAVGSKPLTGKGFGIVIAKCAI
ncbi:MAG: hypothetical protein NT033_03570, partial [Candidatus Omnitrophica bacterium]|nr:hypothetical protein [Candidatus Omnitrophota bacterium]